MSLMWFAFGLVVALVAAMIIHRLTGFGAQKPQDYAGTGPAFDLRRHLSGPILCEGMIYGPTGRVATRFVAQMEGRWDGNVGTLAEHFRYDSGRRQDRCWTLALGNDGAIRAEAPDLVGVGSGRVEGSAVQLRYRIKLDAEAGGHELDVTDWLYLMENGTILNRSQFRKFGIKVAELVATMRPVGQGVAGE